MNIKYATIGLLVSLPICLLPQDQLALLRYADAGMVMPAESDNDQDSRHESNLHEKLPHKATFWAGNDFSLAAAKTPTPSDNAEQELGVYSGKAYFEYAMPLDTANGFSEFQLNRFYFQYDVNISKQHAIRYRLDGDRAADGGKWRPYIKHAFVTWKNVVPNSTAYFGIVGTPTFEVAESYLGIRSVEKSIMDKNKISTSADTGVRLKSKLNSQLTVNLLYANGSSYAKAESNNHKKIYTNLELRMPGNLMVIGFLNYEPIDNGYAHRTFGGFAGFERKSIKLGAEYFSNDVASVDGTKKTGTGISVYGRMSWKMNGYYGNLIARYDTYDPDISTVDDEKQLILVAYDYKASKQFHIMPNFLITIKGDHAPVYAFRLTFEFKL